MSKLAKHTIFGSLIKSHQTVLDRVPIALAYETFGLTFGRLGSDRRVLNKAIERELRQDFQCDGYYKFNEYVLSEMQQDLSFAIKSKINSMSYVAILRDTELYSLFYDSVSEYRHSTLSICDENDQPINKGLQLNDHCLAHPLDFILEQYMTFSELITIIRRDPEKICVIIDILTQMMLEDLSWYHNNTQTTYYTMIMTMPTFLSSKQFRQLYFPFLMKVYEKIVKQNDVLTLHMQGDCSKHYQTLAELPNNTGNIILIAEDRNLKQLKCILGDKMCIGGGLTSNLLDYASEEECKDEVKRLIDHCALGGGFILCNSTVLKNISSTNIGNLKIAIQTAKEYGRY